MIEQIAPAVGEGESASFDRALMEQMAELLAAYAEPEFETAMIGMRTTDGPLGNSGRGVEGMRSVVGDWLDTFESLRAERVEVVQVGDSVVMEVVQVATAQGVEISTPSAIVFKFRDERIGVVEFHLNQEEARASALAGCADSE